MRVLIVEDQSEIRELLRRQVEALGFSADEATNRQDGLAMLFGDSEIGAVILDLGLPPKADHFEEGLTFLKIVQAKNSLAKVIVLTGQSSPVVTMRAIEQGAFDYLEKPVDRQALQYSLRRAMLFRDTHANLRESSKISLHLVADAATEINTKALREQPMQKLIMSLLEKNNFNVSATARELQMSREHLYYYLKKYKIQRPRKDGV
ncbi:MAG: response regulator [Burkholderiaceae bacterium]|jgi:DNA-binding NtrC family response regulator